MAWVDKNLRLFRRWVRGGASASFNVAACPFRRVLDVFVAWRALQELSQNANKQKQAIQQEVDEIKREFERTKAALQEVTEQTRLERMAHAAMRFQPLAIMVSTDDFHGAITKILLSCFIHIQKGDYYLFKQDDFGDYKMLHFMQDKEDGLKHNFESPDGIIEIESRLESVFLRQAASQEDLKAAAPLLLKDRQICAVLSPAAAGDKPDLILMVSARGDEALSSIKRKQIEFCANAIADHLHRATLNPTLARAFIPS